MVFSAPHIQLLKEEGHCQPAGHNVKQAGCTRLPVQDRLSLTDLSRHSRFCEVGSQPWELSLLVIQRIATLLQHTETTQWPHRSHLIQAKLARAGHNSGITVGTEVFGFFL